MFKVADSVDRAAAAEDGAERLRKLAGEYEELIVTIGSMEGFESFLRPNRFSEISHAARDGPVILVNTQSQRCDALALCPSGDIIHIHLPRLSLLSKCESIMQSSSNLLYTLAFANAEEKGEA